MREGLLLLVKLILQAMSCHLVLMQRLLLDRPLITLSLHLLLPLVDLLRQLACFDHSMVLIGAMLLLHGPILRQIKHCLLIS